MITRHACTFTHKYKNCVGVRSHTLHRNRGRETRKGTGREGERKEEGGGQRQTDRDREKERERERGGEREGGREREREHYNHKVIFAAI